MCLHHLNFTFLKALTCQVRRKEEEDQIASSVKFRWTYILSCHFSSCVLISGTLFLLFTLKYYLFAKKKGLYINDLSYPQSPCHLTGSPVFSVFPPLYCSCFLCLRSIGGKWSWQWKLLEVSFKKDLELLPAKSSSALIKIMLLIWNIVWLIFLARWGSWKG